MERLHALVIEISRGATHDGPGMRTTVFFKGCSLHCLWCQNPESISPRQEIWWEARKCIRCLECVKVCQVGAVVDTGECITRDRAKCTQCGDCVEECPAKATAFVAQEWQVEDLVKEVLKDKAYYQAFGGGVTASGGEPLCQARFVTAFFQRLKQEGIHTALDTCGMASHEALLALLPYTDHILFDLKLFDPRLHRQYTGQSNALILENLYRVAATIRASRPARAMKLWIRTPLIPGITDTPGKYHCDWRPFKQRIGRYCRTLGTVRL